MRMTSRVAAAVARLYLTRLDGTKMADFLVQSRVI